MDKTTKALLAAIAIGLFANAFQPAGAQYRRDISGTLDQIQSDLNSIAWGICVNHKLC